MKGRLPTFGRTRGELLILPAATFVLGDTDAEAAEIARDVRRAQVSPQTALMFIEQLWNTELPGFDVDGPLPAFDPVVSDTLISQGRASVRQFAKDPVALAAEWRARAEARNLSAREVVIETTGRQSFIGSAETVATTINELVQADAADGYILVPHITPGGLTPFVDQVVPLLQERGVFRADYDRYHAARPSRPGPGNPAAPPRRDDSHPGCLMRFITITLIVHAPDPHTGEQKSTQERFREVIGNARLAEELGFDGFGVGERHERPFISSSPTVVLSHVAARTTRIRLFTAVTTLSLLDPVRAFEDYATLDHLSGGRLELIIGKGNGAAQRDLFHVTPEDQWDRNAESYEVFRRLWRDNKITYETKFRPPLTEAEVWPRPLQRPIRVWHGSATSKASVDLAARYGDPLFSANVTNPIEPYAELIRYYRERWATTGTTRRDRGGAGRGYYADATPRTRSRLPAGVRRLPGLPGGSACSRCSRRWRTSSSARPH